MYNATQIKNGLIGLIGYEQNYDAEGWLLTDMLTSESGLWFNDVHPLVTIDNIISICPEFNRVEVDQSGINEAFTAWLKNKTQSAIIQTVNDWISAKFENQTAKSLLFDNLLFTSTGDITDTEEKINAFVGFEISPMKSKALVTRIKRIALQYDTNQTVTVELYRNDQKEAVQTVDIVYAGSGSAQWETVNWELDNNYTYWIGYEQGILNGKHINGLKNFTWCYSGITYFPTSHFYSARGFYWDAFSNELPSVSSTKYLTSTNFGINLDMDVKCDYTQFILDQKDLFKSAIWYNLGISILKELAFNADARINRNQLNISKDEIMFEIDGDTRGDRSSTLIGRYREAIDNIQFDQSDIDRVCLPCRRRRVKHKSIGI